MNPRKPILYGPYIQYYMQSHTLILTLLFELSFSSFVSSCMINLSKNWSKLFSASVHIGSVTLNKVSNFVSKIKIESCKIGREWWKSPGLPLYSNNLLYQIQAADCSSISTYLFDYPHEQSVHEHHKTEIFDLFWPN